MKTFKEFLQENPQYQNESIKSKRDFTTALTAALDNLIFNLKGQGSKWTNVAKQIEDVAYRLEKELDNKKAQSDLNTLLNTLPNDKNIIKLANQIEDYLESKI